MPESTPANPPESAPHTPEQVAAAATELRVVAGRLLRQLRAARADSELTMSQAVVVGRLAEGPSSVADLARAERVRPQSMRATLAVLEELGLITRTPHPTDQRSVLISLTESGHRLRRATEDAKQSWLTRTMSERLTPGELDRLTKAVDLLRRLVEP
ncbi:MarR family winged helix-turn-helix transcriptional regulator [Nocardia sp. alder85J]|uniref:MarR family winged helix-turn-helix transcriptional regulator n=1 Tax=Nocardia sp. alder85J TaxID=2862949 RepID=UPI001CD2D0B6|nr:MarR family transcriptional regulator [Nocardia sp. alder85J]MCX4092609.1 MarR family transcriptional regulator [Nocardia sp. alder85J]